MRTDQKKRWALVASAVASNRSPMLGRRTALANVANAGRIGMVMALTAAACSAPKSNHRVSNGHTAQPAEVRFDQPFETTPRLFHTSIDDAFWVSHTKERDRLISSGVRLEISATTGEVLAAAWDTDNEFKSDSLLGALEVAPRLGGGFIHWSRNQLFRSETFTGPLRALTIRHMLGIDAIRGARNGIDRVIIFGESASASLFADKQTLEPPPMAGLVDFAALDEKRAIRADMLGRTYTTIDGGKTWLDVTNVAGIAQKQLLVEPEVVSVASWQGRRRMNADGTLGPLETSYTMPRRGQGLVTFFRDARVEDNNAWWTWRDVPPVQAAVLGGARTDARHAVGFASGAVAEVDLSTLELTKSVTDWPQAGLSCSAVGGLSEPLFICGWDTYQGYGAYVMRARQGEWPPTIERSFTDDGFFVTDDHGALGFVGSCSVSPRFMDPNDSSRMEMMSDTYRIGTKICMRRSATEWIEHEVTLDADSVLATWIPKRDGSAVALVVRKEGTPMPDRTEDPTRVTTQGSVRLVRIPREIGGYAPGRVNWSPYGSSGRTPLGPLVERRARVHDDGRISTWYSWTNSSDQGAGIHMGASIDERGQVTLFPPPAKVASMIATSAYGLALLADGTLAETIDHGKTYRSGGLSPLPPSAFNGYCSMLGCVLGSITRLGWGTPTTTPVIHKPRLDAVAAPTPALRLECSMNGTPEVVDDKLLHRGARQAWMIGYGDAISFVREVENVADAPPPLPPQLLPGPDDPPPDIVAPPKKSLKPTLRTQSLVFRTPFDPDALPKRLDATSSELDNVRRLSVFPLLGKDNDVGLLLISDKNEIVVWADELTNLPLFEQRRYMSDDGRNPAGLLLSPNQATIIGDIRRRITFEEHGPGTQRAPVFFAPDRDGSARKPMTLARRDDGAQGLLVWEGAPPQSAAASQLDTNAHVFQPFTPLAPWSTATMGDDPQCKNVRGWNALVPFEPALWFDVKGFAEMGLDSSLSGMLLVRWSSERLCIDAIDMGMQPRDDYEWRLDEHLVIRWLASGKKRRGGALFHNGTRQRTECKLVVKTNASPGKN